MCSQISKRNRKQLSVEDEGSILNQVESYLSNRYIMIYSSEWEFLSCSCHLQARNLYPRDRQPLFLPTARQKQISNFKTIKRKCRQTTNITVKLHYRYPQIKFDGIISFETTYDMSFMLLRFLITFFHNHISLGYITPQTMEW